MNFTSVKVPGADAIRILNDYRSRFPVAGQYPFLIGDKEDLERIQENAEFNQRESAEVIEASGGVDVGEWIAERRKEIEEFGFSVEEVIGEWPGVSEEKGSIGLHKDILTGKVKPAIYLGLATIAKPWHLPAALKYGAWNECPAPEVHGAFYRRWQAEFGAEITGMSADVLECVVANPPSNREAAIKLAWEQYWYCSDIVEQGCGTVSNLAATLVNSPYWYFWWD